MFQVNNLTLPLLRLRAVGAFIALSSGLLMGSTMGSDLHAQGEPKMDPNTVVAKIDGEPVTQETLDQEIGAMLRQMSGGQPIPPEALSQMRPRLEEQALNQIVLKIQLRGYAKTNAIEISDASVDQQIDQIRTRFPDPAQLEQALEKQGITIEDLRSDMREELLLDTAVQHYLNGVPAPSAETVEAYYQEHQADFATSESVTASHILLGFEPDDSPETKEEKLNKIKELKKEIAGGADFATLAKEHSSCPSSAQGGSLGQFGRGQMVPEFEETAFTLKPGEVSDVVETQFGYHLIQVSAHDEGAKKTLEEVGPEIENAIRQESLKDWFEEIVSKAKIEKT